MKILTKVLLSLIICVVFLQFLFAHILETDKVFLGGPTYLIVEDNFLALSIRKDFEKIDLFFKSPIEIKDNTRVFDESQIVDSTSYQINTSSDKKYLRISFDEKIDRQIKIIIEFKSITERGIPPKRLIKSIDIDGQPFGITDFYLKYLDKTNSNVKYIRGFELNNISHELAGMFGKISYVSIGAILVTLLVVQTFLVFLSAWNFIRPRQISLGDKALFPINLVDTLSKDFSVALGFLGTIISIWTALEIANLDYSNFYQILGIIKMGVFTSVLGLATRTLFSIRELVFRFDSEMSEK